MTRALTLVETAGPPAESRREQALAIIRGMRAGVTLPARGTAPSQAAVMADAIGETVRDVVRSVGGYGGEATCEIDVLRTDPDGGQTAAKVRLSVARPTR